MEGRSVRRRWAALCVLWAAMIFGQSLLPGSLSQAESGALMDQLQLGRLPVPNPDFLLRKLAHFTEFAVLGLLLSKCLPGGFVRPALAAVLCALADETIQLFVPGRSGQVYDVWIDFAGAAAAIWLAIRARKRSAARRAKAAPRPPETVSEEKC